MTNLRRWPAEFKTPAMFINHLRRECGYSAKDIAEAVEYMIWCVERNKEERQHAAKF